MENCHYITLLVLWFSGQSVQTHQAGISTDLKEARNTVTHVHRQLNMAMIYPVIRKEEKYHPITNCSDKHLVLTAP